MMNMFDSAYSQGMTGKRVLQKFDFWKNKCFGEINNYLCLKAVKVVCCFEQVHTNTFMYNFIL